MLEHG